jgi:predicted AAA+ superfamily ATPase
LEELDVREFAATDPRRFLESLPNGAVLDEVQRVPELLSYLQGVIDLDRRPGRWVLTGSHQFHLHDHISQTLAGRIRILSLLPFDSGEWPARAEGKLALEKRLFAGAYPSVAVGRTEPRAWYDSYIQTYVERDVRAIKNIDQIHTFQKFIKLCAARTGQMLNTSSLGVECGMTHNTVKSWIGILEASYLVFLLQPYCDNLKKRLVKTPKLYFFDTGLACSLLGIKSPEDIIHHSMRGPLFETWVVSEALKRSFHNGHRPDWFYWRDRSGHEVDMVQPLPSGMRRIEVKSGQTLSSDSFKGLDYLGSLKAGKGEAGLVYGGTTAQDRSNGRVIPWTGWADILWAWDDQT